MSFRTFTLVVRMPEDDRFDMGLVDDPRGLFTDDEVMFWGSEAGITQQALDLGADPALWEDEDEAAP